MVQIAQRIRVADEAWIATALLHIEYPERSDFRVQEILERARKEGLGGDLRPGVGIHVSYHCVANKPPNPGRYRMLFATGDGTRRLFRNGDPYDSERTGKVTPERDEIPANYRYLLDWYEKSYAGPVEDD